MLALAFAFGCRGKAPLPEARPAPAVVIVEARPAAAVDAGISKEEVDAGTRDAGAAAGVVPPAAPRPEVVKSPEVVKAPEVVKSPEVVKAPEVAKAPKPDKAPLPAAVAVTRAADWAKCASCHAALTAGKKSHAVLRTDGCKTCHQPKPSGAGKCQSAGTPSWELVSDQVSLCQKCHASTATTGKLHAPIKSGGCTGCHDPHASKNPSLMKTWPLEKLCYSCHARVDDEKSVHAPVKSGDCKGCHDPHSSEFAPLLIAEKATLCFECHKQDKLKHGKASHAPFEEGKCLSCHEAHSGASAPLLKATGKKLCLTCHDAKSTDPAAARTAFRIDLGKKKVHKPLQGDGTCQTCHTQQHGGKTKSLLLTATGPETCFKCHAKFDDLPYLHGAVKTGKCTTCHDPHSADEAGLLRASVQKKLCYLCHVDDLSKRRVIHKPILEKGCTACHDPHGSDYPYDLIDGEGKGLCYKCHKPVDKVKRPHAALIRDGCTGCHDPHGADNATLLSKPINALCISCHEKQKDGTHVSVPAHKMFGGSDPKHREKEFSCVSCHAPHGTDNPKLFYFGSSAKSMCVYCHGDKTQPVLKVDR